MTTTVHPRRPRGDEGVSLVLALVFIVLVGLFATVALTKSQNTLASGQQLSLRGDAQYTADGAVDQALTALREDMLDADPSRCAQFTAPTSNGSYTLNGTTATWTCTLLGGRAKKATDVTTSDYAIVLTSPNLDALETQSGSDPLVVGGSIYLNGRQTNTPLKKEVNVQDGDVVSPVDSDCEADLNALTDITVTAGYIKACTEDLVASAQPSVDLPAAPGPTSVVLPMQTTLPGKAKPCKVYYPGLYTAAPTFDDLLNVNAKVDATYFVSGLYYFRNIGTWQLSTNGQTVIGGQRSVSEDTVALTSNDCGGMTDAKAMSLYAPLTGPHLVKTALPDIYFAYGVTWVLGQNSSVSPSNITLTLFTPPALGSSTQPFSLVSFGSSTNNYQKHTQSGPGTPTAVSGFSNNTKAHFNAKIMTPGSRLDLFTTNDTEAVARSGIVAYELLLKASSGGTGTGPSITAPYNKKNPPPPFRTVKIVTTDSTGATSTSVTSVATISNFPPYSVVTESWRSN
jgi:Tfp pilus assembly protein PilX